MRLTVERISEDIVILEKEDMSHIEVEITLLPSEIREGTVLRFDGEKYLVDYDEENETRKRMVNKQRSAFRKK